MEITTRPPSRTWRRTGVALGGLALLLAIGQLVPATLGLQQQPLADGALAGPYQRDTLLYQEDVRAPGELRVGDVITFTAPTGAAAGTQVTRRVIAVERGQARTRGQERDQMWRIQVRRDDVARVVFAVPFAGHPQLRVSWLSWPLIAVLLGLAAVGALVMSGRRTLRRPRPARPAHDTGRPLQRSSAPGAPATDRAPSSA